MPEKKYEQSIFQKAEQHTVRLPRRQKHIVRSRAEPASLFVFEDHPSLMQQSLTTAALSCSKCPFSLESTVVPNHLCGRSAYGFCSCSWLNILLGCVSVLMQLPVQKLKKKKIEKEILQWLFQIFKPGEMKTKTAGKAKLLSRLKVKVWDQLLFNRPKSMTSTQQEGCGFNPQMQETFLCKDALCVYVGSSGSSRLDWPTVAGHQSSRWSRLNPPSCLQILSHLWCTRKI